MARPLKIQYPGAFYHVACRGNGRAKIFFDDKDRKKILGMLEESLRIYRVSLRAYILMTNHFHLLVQTERANLSEFIRRVDVAYNVISRFERVMRKPRYGLWDCQVSRFDPIDCSG